MSDTSPRDQAALVFNAAQAAARRPRPGEVVWQLQNPAGRLQRCVLQNYTDAGAGVTVLLFEGDELLFSRRCADDALARYVATATRQDLLRTGWTDADHDRRA